MGNSWHSKQADAHIHGYPGMKHPDAQVRDELANRGVYHYEQPSRQTSGGRAGLMYWVIVALILVIPAYAIAPEAFTLSGLRTGIDFLRTAIYWVTRSLMRALYQA